MNAAATRHFFDYHFAQNREIWDTYVNQLSDEQFDRDPGYSQGSVRSQIVHIMSADNAWLTELRQGQMPMDLDAKVLGDRKAIRARWDEIEADMRGYLANLSDEMLFEKPFPEGEDHELITWQVLLHVVNHGTDHRAQILRLLNDLGVKTHSQDYIFYVYDHLM